MHLKVDGVDEDSYITSLILAARLWVQGYTEACLVANTTIEETWDGFPCGVDQMRFRFWPVISLSSIVYSNTDGSTSTWSPSTDWVLDKTNRARLAPADGKNYPTAVASQIGSVKMTYVTGFATVGEVPTPFKQAILLLVGQLFENRENFVSKYPTAVEMLLREYIEIRV